VLDCALCGRWVEAVLDEEAARNPLPKNYKEAEHLIYLVYGLFRASPDDVGFHDTRWVALETMLETLSVNDVQTEIDSFEAAMAQAREEAMVAAEAMEAATHAG
jgi:hypothetical protein